MNCFHVTELENLESILTSGIEARDTGKHNHFGAYHNEGNKRVFFMKTLDSAFEWGEGCWEKNVVIEFVIPDGFACRDPYAYADSYMDDAMYTSYSIKKEWIIDWHYDRGNNG
jgi:hypothetical protein